MYDPLLYLVFFVLYTILILIFGRHGFDRSKSLKDYFLADQSLGTWSSVATFCATWFSAASMLGFTGLVYFYGYSTILFTTVCWFLGAALLVLLVDKLYDFGALTVPEFFRIRYNSVTLQVLSGLILLLSYTLYMVIQIQGFGIVIGELLDVPYTVGIFLVFLFIIYTTFGGLYSVARTDVVNFILIIVGTIVAAVLVLNEVGGISNMHATITDELGVTFSNRSNDPFSPLPEGIWSVAIFISAFFSLGLGLAANPQYVVRIWSARNKRTAYRMIFISIILLSIAYLSLAIVGMGGRILVNEASNIPSDEIFTYMMSEFISSPLKGFILISIVAASISTSNSQLLLLASSTVYDVFHSISKNPIPDHKMLFYTRWLIVLLVTCSLLISLTPMKDLVKFSGQIWGIIAATFFFPLYGGLYFTRVNRKAGFLSFVGGLLTYILCFLFIPEDISIYLHPAVPSVIVSGILFFSKIGRSYDETKTNN